MARMDHTEIDRNVTDHLESAASSGVSLTNDVRMQTTPRIEPFTGISSGNVETGDNDIGMQAIDALLSVSFGS